MLLKLNGVGNQRIQYKDHKDIEFDSLEQYILLAKKSISKFGNSIYNGLSKKMLKDEDAISSVANAIMMADWRWDENYQNQNNTKKTKYSYRNQCAIWAIQTYVSKIYSKQSKYAKNCYSLDYQDEHRDINIHEQIADNDSEYPENIIIKHEMETSVSDLIHNIFQLNILTDRQKDYLKLYYLESQTFEKIGKKYNITREAVRQGLNKAISILKELIDVK